MSRSGYPEQKIICGRPYGEKIHVPALDRSSLQNLKISSNAGYPIFPLGPSITYMPCVQRFTLCMCIPSIVWLMLVMWYPKLPYLLQEFW